jgi:GH24 family phage-related lysozyme (muramidase)
MLDKPPQSLKRIVRKVVSDNSLKRFFKLLKKRSTQNQFNALVSLVYNIGINGFEKAPFKTVNVNPNDQTIKKMHL